MNDILIENIKIKSDLQFDLLYESNFYESLDPELKSFLKESYDSGVDLGISLIKQNPILLESMDEGLWDRFKAGVARTGQGLKNVSGIGTPTADSKDAGVESLFNSFKQKFEKALQAQGGGADGAGGAGGARGMGNVDPADTVADEVEKLDDKTKNAPPIDPNAANRIVQQANVPKSLKDKLYQAIRDNPKKTALIIGGLNMAAGALGTLAPMPGAAALSGAVSNTIAQAIVNKAHGKPAMDNFVKNALKGAVVGGLGAGLKAGIANAIHSAGQTVTTPSSQGWADTSDANSPEVAVTQQQSAVSPEDLRNPEPPDTDQNQWADTNDANSPEVAVTQQQSTVSPEDLRNPDQPDADTFADTSDANSPEVQATQQQSAVSPEDLRNPDQPDADVNQWADTSDANSPEVQATQQQVANTPQGTTKPRFKSALDPKSSRIAFDRSRGTIKEEKIFVKSYNNTYVLKKSLNENIEEKWNEEIDPNINEALSPNLQKIYDDFLNDLSKMFKQPVSNIIAFMKSQGDRFKNILNYINQKVTSSVPPVLPPPPGGPPGGTGGTGGGSGTPPVILHTTLDKLVTPDFLSGLIIQYPEKIKNSKLKNNTNTLLSAKSLTKMGFKMTKDDVSAIMIRCNILNRIRFELSLNSSQLNPQINKLFEMKLIQTTRLAETFNRKLTNALAIELSKDTSISGGKSSKELGEDIYSYLSPKINKTVYNMFQKIYLTLNEVSHLLNPNETIYIGVSNKGIKFVKQAARSPGKQAPGKPVAGKKPTVKPVAGKQAPGKKRVAGKPQAVNKKP